MIPTKIKARKMYVADIQDGEMLTDTMLLMDSKTVFVLDASRYGEMFEQMMNAFSKAKLDGLSDHASMKAALRSIGITKGAK